MMNALQIILLIGIVIELILILLVLLKLKKVKPLEVKIPEEKPKYVGSSERARYHLYDCKFVDLIEEKHKLESAERELFEQKKFKPCKNCKPHKN
jgi:hypothetical protein